MKYTKTLLCCAASLSLLACSSTTNAGNYVQTMNQPAAQGGEIKDASTVTLNAKAMNSLKLVVPRQFELNPDGSYTITSRGTGTLFVRATVINEGTRTVQAKWRCKFYDANAMPIGDVENQQVATNPTGLGWHSMVVYPVNSKGVTDDENYISCSAPTKRAVEFRIELHDMTNDVTLYK